MPFLRSKIFFSCSYLFFCFLQISTAHIQTYRDVDKHKPHRKKQIFPYVGASPTENLKGRGENQPSGEAQKNQCCGNN
jgi:hypothetical protein